MTSRVQTVGTDAFNGTYTYTYDASNRLVQVTGPAAFSSRTYAFDGAGNRTSVQVGTGTPVTTTYDAAGLPLSSSDGTSYTHDQVGNLTAIDRTGSTNDRFFTYSSWNTTTKAASTPTGSDVVFTLDALDRVLSRTSGSTTATSSYQGLGETLVKAQVGNSSTTYVHTPGGPLAQKQGNTLRYYVRDLHGDLVAFSDNKAAFKGTAAYDPFGQVLSATGEMGTVPAQGALRFQGDLTDAFTGQVDMGARWYEPVLGRFSSADPLQGELTSPLSLNRFVYGMASPVTFDDPTGLCADPDICPPQIGGTTEYHSDAWIALGQQHRDVEERQFTVDVRIEDLIEPKLSAGVLSDLLELPDTLGFCGNEGTSGQQNSVMPFFSSTCGALLDTWTLTGGGLLLSTPTPTEFRFPGDEGPNPEESYARSQRAQEFGRGVASLPGRLRGGPSDVHVYLGYVDGKPMYVGITNDIARRQRQWGSKYFLDPITDTPLTRGQARAVEEALISMNPGFNNKIHSISPTHTWYYQAVEWGEAWLRAHGL